MSFLRLIQRPVILMFVFLVSGVQLFLSNFNFFVRAAAEKPATLSFTHLVNTPLKFITHPHIKRVIISSLAPPSG